MARMSKHHEELTGGVGRCSVPMWCMEMPAGFCDEPAYGGPNAEASRKHYIPGLACPNHGGPPPPAAQAGKETERG